MFMSLIHTCNLGKEHDQDAKYLDTCRNKRNIVEYDYVGGFSNFQPNG